MILIGPRQVLNDLLTSPLNPPVIDPEINESRVREINEEAVRSQRLLSAPEELETRRQQARRKIAEVGGMMAAKEKGGKQLRTLWGWGGGVLSAVW
jgi:hypothetical protein